MPVVKRKPVQVSTTVTAIRIIDQPSNCFLPNKKEIDVDRGIVGATGGGELERCINELEPTGIIRKNLNKHGLSCYCC